jgi:tight adherence protein B
MDLANPDLMMWGLALFFTLGIVIYALMPSGESKALDRRLKRISEDEDDIAKRDDAPKVQLRREQKDSGIAAFDHFIKNVLPNPDKIRARLARTGKKINISEYLLITMLAIAIFFALFNYIFGLKTIVAILLGVAMGLFLPHMVIGMMGAKRLKNFLKFFPESIDTMVRGIRSGLPITESIGVVAQEMPDPIGHEFRGVRDGVRMGRSIEEAMWDVAKRIDLPEYRYLIIALSIQKETGGNLAETLANVAEVLRRRRQMKLKIKAMSSEAKASAMILGALPFIMIVVLGAVSPEYIAVLFNDPRGNVLCGIALGIMGLGIFIMSQMINFEI